MLNALMDHAVWLAFREYKVTGGHISKEDIDDLDIFIESKGYEPIVRKIISGESFSTPEKKKKHISSLLRYGFSMDEINGALKQLHLDTVDDYDDGIDE